MFKRAKQLWKLSKKEPKVLNKLEKLSDEMIGDGNAVFIKEGSEKDFIEYENEKKGLKGIFGL